MARVAGSSACAGLEPLVDLRLDRVCGPVEVAHGGASHGDVADCGRAHRAGIQLDPGRREGPLVGSLVVGEKGDEAEPEVAVELILRPPFDTQVRQLDRVPGLVNAAVASADLAPGRGSPRALRIARTDAPALTPPGNVGATPVGSVRGATSEVSVELPGEGWLEGAGSAVRSGRVRSPQPPATSAIVSTTLDGLRNIRP